MDQNSSKLQWTNTEAIDLWKAYAGTGGADKNWMINICNWLLGFSIAVIGFAFAQGIHTKLVSEPIAYAILAFFGFMLSIVSAFVTLIYGGYANWNWAKADQIARVYKWKILDPYDDPWTDERKKLGSSLFARLSRRLIAPADSYGRLAPIFIIYLTLSLLSAGVHIIIMIVALLQ
jgi:hypothetical protein